jgi:hypothetical protein
MERQRHHLGPDQQFLSHTTDTAIDGDALNQNTISVNRNIQHDYNLNPEDFETELECDAFLEERERVI